MEVEASASSSQESDVGAEQDVGQSGANKRQRVGEI